MVRPGLGDKGRVHFEGLVPKWNLSVGTHRGRYTSGVYTVNMSTLLPVGRKVEDSSTDQVVRLQQVDAVKAGEMRGCV